MMLSHETRLEMNKGKFQNEIMHDMTVNLAKNRYVYGKSSFAKMLNLKILEVMMLIVMLLVVFWRL